MTTPEGARAARQLVRDCQHRDEWICCWTCATAALARAAQGAPPVGALIHEIAIAAADRFVVLHCRPDHITLTQGALLNLSYTIKDAIRQYLARAAQGAPPPGEATTGDDPLVVGFHCGVGAALNVLDDHYAPDDPTAQRCRREMSNLAPWWKATPEPQARQPE